MLTKADIKLIRSLSDGAARRESGLFVVEGAKMAAEAAGSGFTVRRLFVMRGSEAAGAVAAVPSMSATTSAADAFGIMPEEVSPAEMERISHLKTPPGILALVEIPQYMLDRKIFGKELVLALDGVQDPGNLGTIIRIADWFGIVNMVCSPGSADCFNPKAVQATMGALFRVRVHYIPLPETFVAARREGVPVYGTALDGKDLYGAELNPAGVIVMGSESRGVSPEVAEQITERLLIPSYPAGRAGSESLNVAAATAIVCSEFRRRM